MTEEQKIMDEPAAPGKSNTGTWRKALPGKICR